MNKNRIWFFVSLTLVIIVSYLLITGSPLLTMPLSLKHGIPLGTPITWLGLIALPLTVYFGVQKMRKPQKLWDKYLAVILKVSLIFALLWAPISYLLAGNLSFTFTEKATFQGGQLAMLWFWRYTYGLVILPIVLLTAHWLLFIYRKIKE